MISFDEKPRPTHLWSRSLRVKQVSLHNEWLGSRILPKNNMSWILSNNKNMANVPRTMNEIRINRQETNKKKSNTYQHHLCLWKFLTKKKLESFTSNSSKVKPSLDLTLVAPPKLQRSRTSRLSPPPVAKRVGLMTINILVVKGL